MKGYNKRLDNRNKTGSEIRCFEWIKSAGPRSTPVEHTIDANIF